MNAPAIINDAQFGALCKQADVLRKSGLFPRGLDTPEKILTVMLTGHEIGIPPMRAARGIDVIDGKPEVSPELLLELAYSRIPGFSVEVKESSAECVTIKFNREGRPPHTETYTFEEAKRAGITIDRRGDMKKNWRTVPEAMLRARCISKAKRIYFPDAAGGCYVEGEIDNPGRDVMPTIEAPSANVVFGTGAQAEEANTAFQPPPPPMAPPDSKAQEKAPETPLEVEVVAPPGTPDEEIVEKNDVGEPCSFLAKRQGWDSDAQRDRFLAKMLDLTATKDVPVDLRAKVDAVNPESHTDCQKTVVSLIGVALSKCPDLETKSESPAEA